MQTVNIGFVGCGFMGQVAHLANFASDPTCRIVAIADLRQNLARKVAKKYSIPRVYRDHLELLEDGEVEAVVEITQDDLHAPVAIDAMREGKHVYTEKPMATNLKDAEDMVKTSKREGVKLMVSYMKRYDPGVEMAKRHFDAAMRSSEMGEVTFVRAHCFGGNWICNVGEPITTDESPPPFEKRYPDWLPPALAQDFRTYLNVFCHNLNLVRYFLGDPKAASFTSYRDPTKILQMEYDDFDASVETGSISASFWDEDLEIYLNHGRFGIATPPPLLRNVPAEVKIFRAGSRQEVLTPLPPWEWSFKRSAHHFVHCILEDESPISSGEDSVTDIGLIEGAFQRLKSA